MCWLVSSRSRATRGHPTDYAPAPHPGGPARLRLAPLLTPSDVQARGSFNQPGATCIPGSGGPPVRTQPGHGEAGRGAEVLAEVVGGAGTHDHLDVRGRCGHAERV